MTAERLLLVRVGEERFAFPLAEVIEATEASAVTPLALLPEGVVGQCLYRDRLVPVLDGGALLGVPRLDTAGVMLVIEVDGERVALWVDDVIDTVPVDEERLRPVPAGSGAAGAVLRGVVDLGAGIAALVSMEDVRASVRARLMPEVA